MDDITMICAPYIGVPRVYHGKTPAGWDCWGLVRWVGVHDLGFDWPEYDNAYTDCRNGDGNSTADAISRYLGRWKLTQPHAGCVACFDRRGMRREPSPRIFHVGLIVNAREMLHVTEDGGTCLEAFNGFVWGRYFAGAREFCHD